MKTNRLSKSLAAALNDQLTREAHASQIYLSYAAWANNAGYEGIANFLFRHANEERNHMMKILEYILARGAKVNVESIPAPPDDPKGVYHCFEKVFGHEVDNTKSIYKIVKLSLEEEDWASWNFLQWFVKEQTEEETMSLSLLDKMRIAGGEKASGELLYALDRDLRTTPDDARPSQDVTAINP
ncbi:MAG: ferritin [Chitinophagales bacterium]